MTSESFRFLHAGDFHLEQPLHGVTEIPDDWRHHFVDAPLQAARKVFDAAVKEQVDFVVLSGDLLDPDKAGPRAIAFLLDQFQSLHEKGIAVYWSGGMVDSPDDWPMGLRFPESVQYFPPNRAEEITHMKGDRAIASIYGQSRSTRSEVRLSDFDHTDQGIFAVGTCHGRYEASSLARLRINYWALGGDHERRTLTGLAATAQYAGSPQGRSPEELGPHGCTLVHVEDDGRIRSRFIATDVVRFQREKVTASASASIPEIERLLIDRGKKLLSDAEERPQLVTFVVDGVDRWTMAARKPGAVDKLVEKLRDEFARSKPPLWTLGVEFISPQEEAEAWFEEDTIRGDYLRAVREGRQDPTLPLNFEPFLPERALMESLECDLKLDDIAVRRAVLEEAAILGVELLSADDPGPLDRANLPLAQRRKEMRT